MLMEKKVRLKSRYRVKSEMSGTKKPKGQVHEIIIVNNGVSEVGQFLVMTKNDVKRLN